VVHGESFVSMKPLQGCAGNYRSCCLFLYLLKMDEAISVLPLTPRKRTHLTRDGRRDIQLLGWSYSKIATFTHATERQIQYACQALATPRKCDGQPRKLSSEQVLWSGR
jgi:hypothetical protein